MRVTAQYVSRLERDCDHFNAFTADRTAVRSFVLPGTSIGSARLHFARAVCRGDERRAWQLDDVNQQVRLYLNRAIRSPLHPCPDGRDVPGAPVEPEGVDGTSRS